MDDENKTNDGINQKPMTSGIRKLAPLDSAEDLIKRQAEEAKLEEEKQAAIAKRIYNKEHGIEEEEEVKKEPEIEIDPVKAKLVDEALKEKPIQAEPLTTVSKSDNSSVNSSRSKSGNNLAKRIILTISSIVLVVGVGALTVLFLQNQNQTKDTEPEKPVVDKKSSFMYADKTMSCTIMPETGYAKFAKLTSDGKIEFYNDETRKQPGTYKIISENEESITAEIKSIEKDSFKSAEGATIESESSDSNETTSYLVLNKKPVEGSKDFIVVSKSDMENPKMSLTTYCITES